MADILGFVFAGASTVTALAMLLLVVWQAPRHRHNRLMAVYLATLALWGANNLAARACALSGCSPGVFMLMDVRMPGLDGLEATRLIRASERATAARIPIVAMTASAMKGDRERCLEAGMDGYLTKPIDADELFELVERVATTALDDHVRRREC